VDIYHKAINAISWSDLEVFCEQGTPESHLLDYKQDFPERLQNTIAAMANTWGGVIIVGIEEDDQTKPKLPLKGVPFERGLPDRVTNIDLGNITPPVLPEIGVALSPDETRAIIIVRVHQSHQTPHAVRQNTRVYFRTGNRNNPEDIADIDRITWLLNQRQRSQRLLQTVYETAKSRFDRAQGLAVHDGYSQSTSAAKLSLSMCPVFPKEIYRHPPQLKELLYDIRVNSSDNLTVKFPATSDRAVITVKDAVLASRAFDNGSFWHTELNGLGLFFFKQTLRQIEDSIDAMDIFWRLNEFIHSAELFYSAVGYGGPLQFRLFLDNIREKKLSGYLRGVHPSGGQYTSIDPYIEYEEVVLAHSLSQQKSRLLQNAVAQIGWAFNWGITVEVLTKFYEATTAPEN
jgi:hypothetical protein